VKRPLLALSLALAPALLAGCSIGSNDAGGRSDLDDRTAALQCIQDAGIDDARLHGPEGEQEIVIGAGADAPHVKFFLTAGEAEAEQFQGHGEGAEQIGGALLYVGNGSDDLLEPVEKCLADP
jgi:hypothetical protein